MEKRRKFLKLLGLASGTAIVAPTKIIASISENDKELSELLGHNLDIAPKKIITTMREFNNDKLSHASKAEQEYAKRLSFKSNFQILKRVSHKTDKKIFMYNAHTGETIDLVYWSQGEYIHENLRKINYFMRDFREDKIKKINLKTLEAIHQVSQHTKKGVPLVLNSAYRTKRTNRRVGGAKHSQHLKGNAIDFTTDRKDHTSLYALKRFLIHNHRGGLGYYPRKNFIHIDAGEKRSWRG